MWVFHFVSIKYIVCTAECCDLSQVGVWKARWVSLKSTLSICEIWFQCYVLCTRRIYIWPEQRHRCANVYMVIYYTFSSVCIITLTDFIQTDRQTDRGALLFSANPPLQSQPVFRNCSSSRYFFVFFSLSPSLALFSLIRSRVAHQQTHF